MPIFSFLQSAHPPRSQHNGLGFRNQKTLPEPPPKEGHLPYRVFYPNGSRNHVEHMLVCQNALDCFNSVIADFAPESTPLSKDQVASAARWAKTGQTEDQLAQQFIQNRCQWYPMIKWMFDHPEWGAKEDLQEGAGRLVFYFEREPQILPDDLPRFGLMDNAIMINEVYNFFQPALSDFSDFDRYCQTRGMRWADMDPDRWLSDRVKEAQTHREAYARPSTLPQYGHIGS